MIGDGTEYENPNVDENGEIIDSIVTTDVYNEPDTGLTDEDDTFYETEPIIADETEDNDDIIADNVERIDAAKELKDEAHDTLIALLSQALESGEISLEMNAEIKAAEEQYIENTTVIQDALGDVATDDVQQQLADLSDSAVKNLQDLMNLLNNNGRNKLLFADEDGKLYIEGEQIPKLSLIELDVQKLFADYAEITELVAKKATIEDLNATNATITNLNAQIAEIQTLVGGNLTMDNIQSLVLTADKVTIANALIKDAMIDTVSANKINTGTINTNKVNIQSDDGSMIISGTTQQFKDENNVVRIQIGKDATGNFTFALFSQDGKGILIDETGIKAGAVPDQIITNNMVSDNANISGSKLDINSVINSINGNTSTINSSKIKFDDSGQTLQVAFNQLKKKVDTIEDITVGGDLSSVIEQVHTNTTNIEIAQGQLSTLIANTTITKSDGTVVQLKDAFNSVKDTVDSHTQTINSLETNYKSTLKSTTPEYYASTSNTTQTGGSWSTDSPSWESGKYVWQRMKYTYTDGNTSYSTPVCIQGAKGEQGVKGDTGAKGDKGPQGAQGIPGADGAKGDTGEKGQSLTKSTPQWYKSTSNTTQTGGSWEENMPTITSGYYLWLRYKLDWQNPTSTTYTTPTLEQVAESVKEVSAKQSEFKQDLDGFKQTVNETYTTKSEFNNLEIGSTNLLRKSNDFSIMSGYGGVTLTKTPDVVVSEWGDKKGTRIVTSGGTDVVKVTKPNSPPTKWPSSDIYAVSMWVKNNSASTQVIIRVNGMHSFTKNDGTVNPGESKRIVIIGKGNTASYMQFNFQTPSVSDEIDITVRHAKIEKGNKVTDWSPAPEDIDNAINNVDGKFDNYSTTEQMNSAITQKANEIITNVSSTYTTKNELTGVEQTLNQSISTVSQTANKINWVIKSGTSESNMTLTDKVYTLISKNIKLTADRIDLNGYVSNEDANWSIDLDGNMTANNLNIEGQLSTDTLVVSDIDNPKYPATLDSSIYIYVNTSTGNDDTVIAGGAVYKTLQGAIDAIPKFMNGKTVKINIQSNITENVNLYYYTAGSIRVYFNGKTLSGYVKGYCCSATINMYGGTSADTAAATGVVHPYTGVSFGGRSVSMGFEACMFVGLYNLKVYGSDNLPSDVTSDEKVCVGAQSGTGNVYCSNISIVNAVIGFRVNNLGHMQIRSSSGIASKYAFSASSGGTIGLNNQSQAGGVTANTHKASGGSIWYENPTFKTGGATSDSSTSGAVSTTKTITIKSTLGDTYRSTVYNNWKKDGTVRQGDWGYGDCNGCWFFGSQFEAVNGKTITKVTITINRQSGGSSSAVGLVVKSHGHTNRPSGSPTYRTTAGTLSLATGASGTLTITNSTILNEIKSGVVKGFGIQSAYTSGSYATCSGSVTVKITYKE